MISSSKSEGLIWNPTTKELTVAKLGHLHIAEVELLDENLFSKVTSHPCILLIHDCIIIHVFAISQHVMSDYQQKILRSYLDKGTEKYITPGQKKTVNPIKEVAILKPKVERVEFHKYSGEHAVILEGQNLWFCHEVRLGEKSNNLYFKTSAQKATGLDIKFNFKPSGKTPDFTIHKDDLVKVALYSHFANPIRSKVSVGQVCAMQHTV